MVLFLSYGHSADIPTDIGGDFPCAVERVLDCMAQRQIVVNNETVIKLSQQEIADMLGFTKSKVNSIIRELIQKGYVTQVNTRGKYALTENATRELRNMQSKEAAV